MYVFRILGRALTKTFLHNPFMGANPIGFKQKALH